MEALTARMRRASPGRPVEPRRSAPQVRRVVAARRPGRGMVLPRARGAVREPADRRRALSPGDGPSARAAAARRWAGRGGRRDRSAPALRRCRGVALTLAAACRCPGCGRCLLPGLRRLALAARRLALCRTLALAPCCGAGAVGARLRAARRRRQRREALRQRRHRHLQAGQPLDVAQVGALLAVAEGDRDAGRARARGAADAVDVVSGTFGRS